MNPSATLVSALREELSRHPPFAQMAPEEVDEFILHGEQLYFAPGEVVQEPAHGVVTRIFCIRRGAVARTHGIPASSAAGVHYEAGDLFPLAAAMAGRPVTATYEAAADTFVLAVPVERVQALAARSRPFAAFLDSRMAQYLELSRQALARAYSAQALQEQSLETPLGRLATRDPVTCTPQAPLREALALMHHRGVGSILVTDAAGRPEGILTRRDVLGRVALAGRSLEAPVSEVMSRPVRTLTTEHTADDAALLIAREGIRHVPVTRDGRAVGIVSEHDLFGLQRQSLTHVGATIRRATDTKELGAAAQGIRRLAANLLGQGVQARQLTALTSQLNDLLTRRLLDLKASEHGVALERACWLALGSEGRGEQTIATDQDNALILRDGIEASERAAFLRFAADVNAALDACGFPLCRGGIMAGRPQCCLTLAEWRERFLHWIAHGAPQDLLDASIFFDLRGIAGDTALAGLLRAQVVQSARETPRFLKQLALNGLSREPPLNWLGGVETDAHGSIDLKLQGTAIFVDAARVYALAQGIGETGTRERLEGVARAIGVPPAESGAWIASFEFLQMLRLRVQLGEHGGAADPNKVAVASLHDVDRRILKESLRMARRLQQRLRLDYDR